MFSDGSYIASLSRMLPWSSSARVKGHSSISLNLTISMVGDLKASILFTASVNSTVKVWSLDTLTLMKVFDLNSETNATIKQSLDIKPTNLLSLIASERHMGYVAYYSPFGDGQFRIWGYDVTSDDQRSVTLSDVTEKPVIPVAPNENSIWMISDFTLEEGAADRLNLWVMWKSNKSSRIHVLFDISVPARESIRELSWRAIVPSVIGELTTISVSSGISENTSNEFMKKLFQLGIFSPSIFETVLPIFERHYSIYKSEDLEDQSDEHGISLPERVVRAVESTVSLPTDLGTDALNYESYWRDLQKQWSRFERLCIELSNQGNEALSLCKDPVTKMISVVRATNIGPIRICIDLEYANLSSSTIQSPFNIVQRNNKLAGLYAERADTTFLNALASFRKSLSRPVIDDFISAIEEDAFKLPSFSVEDRIWMIFDASLNDQIPDSALDLLIKRLNVIESLDQVLVYCFGVFHDHTIKSRFGATPSNSSARLTTVGVDLLSVSIETVVSSTYNAIVDILLFLVLSTCDEQNRFDIEQSVFIYTQFLRILQSYTFMNKVSNMILDTPKVLTIADEDILSASVYHMEVSKSAGRTAFEPGGFLLQYLFQDNALTLGKYCASLLETSRGSLNLGRAVEFGISFWSIFDVQLPVAAIICSALEQGYVEQSKQLMSYLPISGFGFYVKGRVFVQSGDFNQAATFFHKTAAQLGMFFAL